MKIKVENERKEKRGKKIQWLYRQEIEEREKWNNV